MPSRDLPPAPVSVAIDHQVRPENAAAFEAVIHAMTRAAERWPGYDGVQVIQPHESDPRSWRVVVRFASENDLRCWRESSEWSKWRAKAERLTVGAPRVEQVNGLEAWFQLPERATAPSPPKWKTAVISGVGIYPLLLVTPPLLDPLTHGLPFWLGTALSVVLMSPLITWVVMPTVTRLFKSWLFADPGENE